MSNDRLAEYSDSIRTLRKQCLEAEISEDEFRKLYFESLRSLETNPRLRATNRALFSSKHKVILLGIIGLGILVYNFKYIYTSLVCNLQEFIYPGLRILRKMSIPLISLFPSLSDLYHESCLVQNPFFTVVDMDCWPCSSVNNVRILHHPVKPVHPQNIAPFIYETEQSVLNMDKIRHIYLKNKAVIDKEAGQISIHKTKYFISPHEVFLEKQLENELYIWKFNNMNVNRVLRKFIPRPKIIPKFGQSTERFIIIDSSQKMFKLPDTECSFSFLLSLSGSRDIILEPAEECKHQCKSLKIELRETYLLWYNWWYWRPVIQQSANNITFIAHIGSYC